jgi:hypothetical protein
MSSLKSKKKFCDGCGEQRFIWKNELGKRYCKYCWSRRQTMTVKVKPTKKQKPLATRSLKRAKQEREYSRLRKDFLLQREACEAHLQGICTHNSTDVHHIAGRSGDRLNDTSKWMAVCRSCHTWIEEHPVEATEKGFRESKI